MKKKFKAGDYVKELGELGKMKVVGYFDNNKVACEFLKDNGGSSFLIERDESVLRLWENGKEDVSKIKTPPTPPPPRTSLLTNFFKKKQ